MIKVIIFDVDGVLVDSRKANMALFKASLVRAGYQEPSDEEVNACFHLPAVKAIEKLISTDNPEKVSTVMDYVLDGSTRQPELFEFPEKLEETLEHLRKQYKLAIVTSRVKFGIDEVFSAREIKHLFDVVVTMENYSNPKPHPEPLLVALDKLKVKPKEAVYIGDSLTDIDAAVAAGMYSIHISIKPHSKASAHIRDFDSIIDAINALNNRTKGLNKK